MTYATIATYYRYCTRGLTVLVWLAVWTLIWLLAITTLPITAPLMLLGYLAKDKVRFDPVGDDDRPDSGCF